MWRSRGTRKDKMRRSPDSMRAMQWLNRWNTPKYAGGVLSGVAAQETRNSQRILDL